MSDTISQNTSYQHVFKPESQPFIRPDCYELFAAVLIPLCLVHVATLARILLKKVPAYRALGHERQASLAALVAVMMGKIGLVTFCMPLLFGTWDTAESMSFRIAFIIQTSIYIFDMTFRTPSISLWMHHLVAIGSAMFPLWYHAQYSSHDLYYLRGITIFYTFAVGLADLGADFSMLFYYLCRGSPWLAGFVENAAHYLVIVRAIQWSFFIYTAATHPPSNPWAVWGMVPSFVVWMREEFLEWEVINGLGKKLRSTMEKPYCDKSEAEKAVDAKVEPSKVVNGSGAAPAALLAL